MPIWQLTEKSRKKTGHIARQRILEYLAKVRNSNMLILAMSSEADRTDMQLILASFEELSQKPILINMI